MNKPNSAVVNALGTLLADSYILYLKTHNYHWNVTGPMFTTLHTICEKQYMELSAAIDETAERIRALGAPAPGNYKRFTELSSMSEDDGVPRAEQMVKNLVQDSGIVATNAERLIRASEAASDDASADLGIRRLEAHQKAAWMLRSHLE